MSVVFFGHQSVGQNILDAVPEVQPSCAVRPLSSLSADLPDPGIYHSRIGANGDPRSKVDSFRSTVAQLGDRLDVALMKFCYVDIRRDTDVSRLVLDYEAAVSALVAKHPKLRIIHVTSPLRTLQLGLRSRAKLVLGRPIWSCEDNLRREAYNDKLRATFGETDLFDLAALESTGPSGEPIAVRYRGARVASLQSGYTYDGGHLNATGAAAAARGLLPLCGL